MVEAARRVAADGTPMYFPDAGGIYSGVWTRDFAYMARLVPAADIRAGFELIMRHQRPDGTVPDHVWGDGVPVYTVGGTTPPTDNPQFLVTLAYEHYIKIGTAALFAENADRLEAALDSVPRSSTGLVHVDPAHPHSSYGFTDWVVKTGDELFTSLLFIEAARQLDELYAATGDSAAAARWRTEAERVRAALNDLWDEGVGLFWAASVDGRRHDLWGSAFAVAQGIASAEQAGRIGDFFRTHRDQIIRHGQIRHLPGNQYWERFVSPLTPGTYQNGGYWSTASGWVMKAVPDLADDIVRAMVADFRANGVNEWTNDREICALGVPQYVVSAVLPSIALPPPKP